MLNREEYESLKKSCKGWGRERLAQYGVEWPPAHGWRKMLLQEYEQRDGKQTKRKHFDKKEFDYLEILFEKQLKLTARWYERISGQAPWLDGERDRIECLQEELTAEINRIIGTRELKDISAYTHLI